MKKNFKQSLVEPNWQREAYSGWWHPSGIVIHPDAEIGYNCIIFQQVTIIEDVKIGSDVAICAGAKIIRRVSIGDRAIIGANAVVRTDVPAGATAVRIPTRIIPNPERVDDEIVFDPAQEQENPPATAENSESSKVIST